MQACARNAEYAADSPARLPHTKAPQERVTVAPWPQLRLLKLRRSALWVVDVMPSYNASVVTTPGPRLWHRLIPWPRRSGRP
jgi:hypothetical protein